MARVATVAALALAIAAVFFLMFGGVGKGYRVHTIFQSAGQLIKGNRVLIGGSPAGKVVEIELAENNQVDVTLEIKDEYAPLHEGTTVTQRSTSLSGVANKYVSVNPGPNNRPELLDGSVIGQDHTTSMVNIDQFYDTLDRDGRKHLRTMIRQFSVAFEGKGAEANRAFKYLGPALSSSSDVVGELMYDERAFERFLVDSSRLVTALAERRSDLSALVRNADVVSSSVASESAALSEALDLLPSTLSRANATLPKLRETLDELDPLVEDLEPAADKLAPFLKDLRPVLRDGKPVIRDLRRIVTTKGSDNDITDLLKDAPSLGRKSKVTFPDTIEALKDLQPIFDFGAPYSPDLTGVLTRLAEVPAIYDANGHFMRVQPGALSFTLQGNSLTQIPDSRRESELQTGRVRRCPGGATQAAADGSNPFLPEPSFDCDPSTVPPGP